MLSFLDNPFKTETAGARNYRTYKIGNVDYYQYDNGKRGHGYYIGNTYYYNEN